MLAWMDFRTMKWPELGSSGDSRKICFGPEGTKGLSAPRLSNVGVLPWFSWGQADGWRARLRDMLQGSKTTGTFCIKHDLHHFLRIAMLFGVCSEAFLTSIDVVGTCSLTLTAMAEQIVIHRDDIVMEGFMVKQSKFMKEWRQRWFVLTPQYLCSFKNQGEYRNPTEFIRLGDCQTVKSAEDISGKENSICVQTPERAFLLIARTPEEKEQWISRIGRQMVRRAVLVDDEFE